MYDSQRIVAKVRTKNIAEFLLKNTTKQNLIEAIRTVTDGDEHFDKVVKETHYLAACRT